MKELLNGVEPVEHTDLFRKINTGIHVRYENDLKKFNGNQLPSGKEMGIGIG